ncbi:MAG: YceI family protein [Bacteroidia bacterium]|nr:YceI family protein [Bacteroidia bacterium]
MWRRTRYAFAILTLLINSNSLFAQNYLRLTECEITFMSVADLEIIKASTNNVAGILDLNTGKFAFRLTMSSFDGFNNPKQKEHFREKFIETDKFPDATFEGKIVDGLDLGKEGARSVRVKGILNIHGVSVEKLIPIDLVVDNSSVKFVASFNVLLDEHKIKVPKIVRYNIAEEISVDVLGTFTSNK